MNINSNSVIWQTTDQHDFRSFICDFITAFKSDDKASEELNDFEKERSFTVRVAVERLLSTIPEDRLKDFVAFIETAPATTPGSQEIRDFLKSRLIDELRSRSFDCRLCGMCCTGRSGPIPVLSIERDGFPRPDLIKEGQGRLAGLTLLKQAGNGACAALECEKGRHSCSIYADRPIACVTYTAGNPLCLQVQTLDTRLDAPSPGL